MSSFVGAILTAVPQGVGPSGLRIISDGLLYGAYLDRVRRSIGERWSRTEKIPETGSV